MSGDLHATPGSYTDSPFDLGLINLGGNLGNFSELKTKSPFPKKAGASCSGKFESHLSICALGNLDGKGFQLALH